ncbi:TPA: hypothetical protein HA324_00870 [Candidatus Thalassarchaeaceae archaeon]|nr:MAG TPA: hypothetical protein D7I14_00860 [Candidatus Poseidoniales archaeon]HII41708.1 hypothetical protein [Candidatus Thalassarchaeaceae archaeon]
MEPYNDGWLYSGSACERLANKSAIGRKIGEKLLLSSAEVIFCHNHRHLDWPYDNWFEEEIIKNPNLINESIIIEALRVPGNKLKLIQILGEGENILFTEGTWGLRWNSNNHPRKDEPESEVRWFHSSDIIDREKLLLWAENVNMNGRRAEVLIVDNEQAVVTYNITSENPKGDLLPPSKKVIDKIGNYERKIIDNGRIFLKYGNEWPCDQIGIDYDEGRIIDEISNHFITLDESKWSLEVKVYANLLERGLHPRPGFKYGTLWRCYDQKIGTDHAPWLIVNPSTSTVDWESACLASRLASGVNKIWLQPLEINSKWYYLGIVRPPANSRWTNPVKK